MNQYAVCPRCGHDYEVFSMYAGAQDLCPRCRAKREQQIREDRGQQGAAPMTDPTKEAPLPCPWCGTKEIALIGREDWMTASCCECDSEGPHIKCDVGSDDSIERACEEAVAKWNRVARLAAAGAECEGATEAWTWTHPTKECDYAAPYYWSEEEAREVSAHGHAFDRWKLRRVLILAPEARSEGETK